MWFMAKTVRKLIIIVLTTKNHDNDMISKPTIVTIFD